METVVLRKMLTTAEIAEILQVSYETALNFIKYSGIDFIRIGRQYRVSAEKLSAFLSKRGQVHIDFVE